VAVEPGNVGDHRRAVLLVDGASAAAAAVTRTLDDHNVEYVIVGRWTEVLEQLVEGVFEFVLLDLDMAGAPGVRLIGVVQTAAPDVAIVVISELEVIDLAALEAGASLVMRPSDLRPLQEMVRHGAVPASDP
jgi:DNA-binding NtrC family response regulator